MQHTSSGEKSASLFITAHISIIGETHFNVFISFHKQNDEIFSLQAHMLTRKHTIHRKKGLRFKSPKQKWIQFHIDTIVFYTFSCLSTQSLKLTFVMNFCLKMLQ